MRIHPAVSAHAAANTAQLLGDRFTKGVGTGEALNEHALGDVESFRETFASLPDANVKSDEWDRLARLLNGLHSPGNS